MTRQRFGPSPVERTRAEIRPEGSDGDLQVFPSLAEGSPRMMGLEVVHKWITQSTGCGNRGGVDNGVAAGQGVRWECCEKCGGPRLVTEGLTPSDPTGKELLTW